MVGLRRLKVVRGGGRRLRNAQMSWVGLVGPGVEVKRWVGGPWW